MAKQKSTASARPPGTTADLRRTALHEAGHAVLHILLDLGCERVTVVPNLEEHEAGHAAHGGEWGRPDKRQDETAQLRVAAEEAFWLRHAIALYAGAEAVRRSGAHEWHAGAEDDDSNAVDAVNRITGDAQSIDLLFGLAKRRCEILVEHYWPEICALARALEASRTLSGSDARAVVRQSLKSRRGLLLRW